MGARGAAQADRTHCVDDARAVDRASPPSAPSQGHPGAFCSRAWPRRLSVAGRSHEAHVADSQEDGGASEVLKSLPAFGNANDDGDAARVREMVQSGSVDVLEAILLAGRQVVGSTEAVGELLEDVRGICKRCGTCYAVRDAVPAGARPCVRVPNS